VFCVYPLNLIASFRMTHGLLQCVRVFRRGPCVSIKKSSSIGSAPAVQQPSTTAAMSLEERLTKIRDNPKLSGQQQVLSTCLPLLVCTNCVGTCPALGH
jgi:hypothetical protein